MKLGTAIDGGSRYARALATGDRADVEVSERRYQICLACEAGGNQQVPGRSLWRWTTCGKFAEETESTCGCIVALTVLGVTMPAGKTRVGSERCPRSKW